MSTLGIGVRVWIGWVAEGKTQPSVAFARCRVGVITGGPFPPLTICCIGGLNPRTMWNVTVDGEEIAAAEYLLHPIDDDDARAEESGEREVVNDE